MPGQMKKLIQIRKSSANDLGKALRWLPGFHPIATHVEIGQFQFNLCLAQKSRLLVIGIEHRDVQFRHAGLSPNRQHDARQTTARTHVKQTS